MTRRYEPHAHVLADGGRVELRQILPDDKPQLQRGLERMSPESRHLRFFRAIKAFSDRDLAYLTEVDHDRHDAWVAIDLDHDREGVGVARYIALPDNPQVAEAAVTVVDRAHGRGIGGLLLAHLARSALANGIHTFRAYVLGDNKVMLNLLGEVGGRFTGSVDGARVLDMDLRPDRPDLPDTPLARVFQTIAKEAWREK